MLQALTVLLRVVVSYWACTQLIAVLAIAPWLTHSGTYRSVFEDPVLGVNPTWFSFFQVVSAYTNLGMRCAVPLRSTAIKSADALSSRSLMDTSMIPFQRAYWLIIVMCLLILGGNTAFPILCVFRFAFLVARLTFPLAVSAYCCTPHRRRKMLRSLTFSQMDHLQDRSEAVSHEGDSAVPPRPPTPMLHLPLSQSPDVVSPLPSCRPHLHRLGSISRPRHRQSRDRGDPNRNGAFVSPSIPGVSLKCSSTAYSGRLVPVSRCASSRIRHRRTCEPGSGRAASLLCHDVSAFVPLDLVPTNELSQVCRYLPHRRLDSQHERVRGEVDGFVFLRPCARAMLTPYFGRRLRRRRE